MPTKRRRGDAWHYTIKRAGLLDRPVYLSFDDEDEGDEYCKRLEALLDRGVVPDELRSAPKTEKRLRDHARDYLAAQHVADSDKSLLSIALQRLPPRIQLKELTFVWACDWVSSMKREQNLAPSTLRHHVGALARCLDWLASRGELPANPLRLLPKGYATYTPRDAEEVARVEGEAKQDVERDRRLVGDEEPRIRRILAGDKPQGRQRPLTLKSAESLSLLFDLALETAMRMREMYTLDWGQVDLPKRTIFLDRTKNGSKRQVPLSSVAVALLDARRQDAGQVFPWWSGSLDLKELRRATSLLSRQFSRAFEAAGCLDLNFHDLRHEATSRLYERTTLTDAQIAKITGHKSLRMLLRYANLRASNLAERMW